VDDKNYGEKQYPPELLRKWKREHEGRNGPVLDSLPPISEDKIASLLIASFTPPLARLEKLTEQLERTGTLTADTLRDLRNIVTVMSNNSTGPEADSARKLAYSAEVFENQALRASARSLAHTMEVLPTLIQKLDQQLKRLGRHL
jgi:hypothetical protein